MNISIEPAKKEDAPKILEIMEFSNMHNVPSPEMPVFDWKCFFVAKIKNKIVGAAGYQVLSSTEAKTTLMTVDPNYRRFGIGKALQEKRMLFLFEKGISKLRTNADIPETIKWYKKNFGYQEVGKLKKMHEFGRSDIAEWTTLETDLNTWGKAYAESN